MLRALSFLIGLLAALPACAQSVLLQGGPWGNGHAPMYVGAGTSSQPVVTDSGPAGGGGLGVGLSELLITQRGTGNGPYADAGTGPVGTNFCDYDAPITNSGGYHYLCFSPNAQGGGLIAYGAGNGAPELPLKVMINGVLTNINGLPQIGSPEIIANISGSSAFPAGESLSDVLDASFDNAQGDILYRGASGWAALAAGTSGQVLATQGAGADPHWVTAGSGTVTSVATGTGLTGGPVTTTGTIALAPVANNRVLANISGSSAAPSANTVSDILDSAIASTQGDIIYRSATGWVALAPGASGQFLTSGGTSADPSWTTGGSVTSVATGAGLTGGPITGSGTISLASVSNNSILANISGSSAAPSANTLSAIIDSAISNTQGSVLYRNATSWVALGPGTSGQVLTTGGASANPSWSNAGSGTVTSVATGTGLTGGPITTSGTISFAAVANNRVLANISGSSAAPSANTLSDILDSALGSTRGDVLYRGASGWTALAPGTAGFALVTQGPSADPQWAAVSGSTGCTISGGAQFQIIVNNGASGCSSSANASVQIGALTLGGSGTAGSVTMGNATSGTVTLQPVTGALGTVTASLPANTGTIAELNLAQTWTAAQTFANSRIVLLGSSTGATIFTSDNSGALNYTLHVPAANDTLATLAASQALTNKTYEGMTITSTTGTFSLANAKTFSVLKSLTLDGTDGTTMTFPGSSDTVMGLGAAQTVTGAKTFNAGTLKVAGAGSGVLTLAYANSATSGTITFPAVTDTVAVLGTPDQTLSGGANVTSFSLPAGSFTVDCGKSPLQYQTNSGAFTITAPVNDGSCIILETNGAAAGAITFSGFSVGSNTGDSLDTTNGHKFMIQIARINGSATYSVKALQ